MPRRAALLARTLPTRASRKSPKPPSARDSRSVSRRCGRWSASRADQPLSPVNGVGLPCATPLQPAICTPGLKSLAGLPTSEAKRCCITVSFILVTAFVILVCVAVGEPLDAHRQYRADGAGSRRIGACCTSRPATASPPLRRRVDHLVSTRQHLRRDRQSDCLRRLRVERQRGTLWRLHRHLGRVRALQDAIDKTGGLAHE